MSEHKIWLVGAGQMALEYVRVLKELPCEFIVIGRGESSATAFEQKAGVPVICGGLEQHLRKAGEPPEMAILAAGVLDLAENARLMMNAGIKRILLEKPGGINYAEIETLSRQADLTGCDIFVAYNRRFYTSVFEAEKYIKEDGGVESFQFDFTEWSSSIEKLNKPEKELNGWLLTNSGHVLDMAFFMGGEPQKLESFVSGHLPWHPAGSVFAGAGIAINGALFSYHANWGSAGRWGVEINTPKRKLIFRPLEKLQVMLKDSVVIDLMDLDYSLDINYKPGVYLQTQAFLDKEDKRFLTIQEQLERMKWYYKIMNVIPDAGS